MIPALAQSASRRHALNSQKKVPLLTLTFFVCQDGVILFSFAVVVVISVSNFLLGLLLSFYTGSDKRDFP